MLVSECRDKLVLFVAAVVVFLFDVQLGVFAVSSKCVRFFFRKADQCTRYFKGAEDFFYTV